MFTLSLPLRSSHLHTSVEDRGVRAAEDTDQQGEGKRADTLAAERSEEHTSELQSRFDLVFRHLVLCLLFPYHYALPICILALKIEEYVPLKIPISRAKVNVRILSPPKDRKSTRLNSSHVSILFSVILFYVYSFPTTTLFPSAY